MVIDSFMKDGISRGTSFLIDMDGNYIIDVNRGVCLNKRADLYDRLTNAADSDLTNEEAAKKLNDRETFSFYHIHAEDGTRDLLYFIPSPTT